MKGGAGGGGLCGFGTFLTFESVGGGERGTADEVVVGKVKIKASVLVDV